MGASCIEIERETAPRMELCRELADIMSVAWKFKDERDVMPPWKFFVTPQTGGELLVAYSQRRAVGFAFASCAENEPPSLPPRYLYLDMVGVLPALQSEGIGESLIRATVEAAARRRIERLQWTFDPLEGPNANVYIRKLGGEGVRFYENYYGELSGSRHEGSPTDRVLVQVLTSDGRSSEREDLPIPAVFVDGTLAQDDPVPARVGFAIPRDLPATGADRDETRDASRRVFDDLVNRRGYIIRGFVPQPERNIYVLETSAED